MLGELRLRIAARRARGRVTVPLLVHGDDVFMDFVAIARHAEEGATGARPEARPGGLKFLSF